MEDEQSDLDLEQTRKELGEVSLKGLLTVRQDHEIISSIDAMYKIINDTPDYAALILGNITWLLLRMSTEESKLSEEEKAAAFGAAQIVIEFANMVFAD